MFAPILAFTADEAWEFVPGRTEDSVHMAKWQATEFVISPTERITWKNLIALREYVLPELEKARQAKQLGKALEAKLALKGQGENAHFWRQEKEALRELLMCPPVT